MKQKTPERSPLRVPDYSKSWSRSELVQDLNDLAVLCRRYQPVLGKAGFDMGLAERASDKSRKLSLLIAQTILDRKNVDQFKHRRNVLCQQILLEIRDICSVARLVFNRDPRIQNYYSSRSHF